MTTTHPRIVNPAVPVHWLGWESDTYRLGQHGWEFSMRQDPRENVVQVSITHPQHRIYGISRRIDNVNFLNHYHNQGMIHNRYPFEIRMLSMAENLVVQMPMSFDATNWEGVDTVPYFERAEAKSLADLKIFRPLPPPESDIILAPPSFDEILQMALDHQAPKQKELREKARRATDTRAKLGAILRVSQAA